jgi:hypothetical protein
MSTATLERPFIRKTPWLTKEDFARAREDAKRPMSREEAHESLIRAGIIDEAGNWIDHPYYAMGYGPKREDTVAAE